MQLADNDEELEVEDEDDSCLQQWVPTPLKIEGWLGCSAHRLQLVIHDGYAELKSYPRVQSILSKAKAISTLSCRSSHFAYSLSHKIPVKHAGTPTFISMNMS